MLTGLDMLLAEAGTGRRDPGCPRREGVLGGVPVTPSQACLSPRLETQSHQRLLLPPRPFAGSALRPLYLYCFSSFGRAGALASTERELGLTGNSEAGATVTDRAKQHRERARKTQPQNATMRRAVGIGNKSMAMP